MKIKQKITDFTKFISDKISKWLCKHNNTVVKTTAKGKYKHIKHKHRWVYDIWITAICEDCGKHICHYKDKSDLTQIEVELLFQKLKS